MKKVLIIALALVSVAGGYFGWQWVQDHDVLEDGPFADDEEEKEKQEYLYDLEAIVTDLKPREGGERSVVRVDIELQCRDEESHERVQNHAVYVRDEILAILRGTGPEELEGDGGMEELGDKIVERVNGILAEGEIVDVYFTEMMVQ